jgi:rSAM/selenodomain-associated transferase 2
MNRAKPPLSIILPVLNESAGLRDALRPLQALRAEGVQVIAVDGGSTDDTMALAAPLVDRVLHCEPGRGRQMNVGASHATGEVLLFLHADTRLPDGALHCIQQAMMKGAHWGRFDVSIAGRLPGLRMVATTMNWRSRWTGIATGDQGLFVRPDLFWKVGGFPVIPLMEDIVLSSSLRQQARPACLRERVTTSGRRWEKHGLWKTIISMWWLRLRFYFGADPKRLAREYGYAVPE